MNECPNCGMLPFACVCVPWCYKHDRLDYDPPCWECVQERKRDVEAREARRVELAKCFRKHWRDFCEMFE